MTRKPFFRNLILITAAMTWPQLIWGGVVSCSDPKSGCFVETNISTKRADGFSFGLSKNRLVLGQHGSKIDWTRDTLKICYGKSGVKLAGVTYRTDETTVTFNDGKAALVDVSGRVTCNVKDPVRVGSPMSNAELTCYGSRSNVQMTNYDLRAGLSTIRFSDGKAVTVDRAGHVNCNAKAPDSPDPVRKAIVTCYGQKSNIRMASSGIRGKTATVRFTDGRVATVDPAGRVNCNANTSLASADPSR